MGRSLGRRTGTGKHRVGIYLFTADHRGKPVPFKYLRRDIAPGPVIITRPANPDRKLTKQ